MRPVTVLQTEQTTQQQLTCQYAAFSIFATRKANCSLESSQKTSERRSDIFSSIKSGADKSPGWRHCGSRLSKETELVDGLHLHAVPEQTTKKQADDKLMTVQSKVGGTTENLRFRAELKHF